MYQVYTKLPEEGLERIKQDFSATKVQTANNNTPERIEYVMNYLSQNTEYSLSPGKLPKGKDFVEYFLYENKVGYCSHYASAATLMLRAMGIPARYVEGYAVSISDVIKEKINVTDEPNIFSDNTAVVTDTNIVEIAVKDYNAHAWVEVYFDSCGWIPLEFTPGSAVDYNGSMVDEMALIGDLLKEEEELIPTEVPTEPTPIEEEQVEEQPVDETKKADTAANKGKENRATQIDAMFFVFLVLFIAVVGIAILIRIRRRRRERHTRNHNKKALFLFIEIEKILSACKGLPKKGIRLEDGEAYVKEHCSYVEPLAFTRCLENVRKARFGRGSITAHELEEVEVFHQSLYEGVYKELSLGMKVYLKFILSV
ncbi:MAG: transglutaminase-like domain-containing protein [Mobilitalea sp.]